MFIRKISVLLGRIPSLIYALTYLICIPLFALIYNSLPYQFYHATVQYENSLFDDKDSILKIINDAIVERFKISNKSSEKITKLGWKVSINQLYFESIQVEGNKLKIPFIIYLQQKNLSENTYSIKRVRSEFLVTLAKAVSGKDGSEIYLLEIAVSDSDENSPIEFLLSEMIGDPLYAQSEYGSTTVSRFTSEGLVEVESGNFNECSNVKCRSISIGVSEEVYKKIKELLEIYNGKPPNSEGNFWRMFYLSSVTITTLGYGDIVPVTTTTRILISLETVLGVILIGLFLNALAYENSNYKNDESKSKIDS